MHPVRITVMKRPLHSDLIAAHLPHLNDRAVPCEKFSEGQSFLVDAFPPEKPEGFCDWAWVDIQRNVAMALLGSELTPGCAFTCCSDGLRPVTFRIERLAE